MLTLCCLGPGFMLILAWPSDNLSDFRIHRLFQINVNVTGLDFVLGVGGPVSTLNRHNSENWLYEGHAACNRAGNVEESWSEVAEQQEAS